MTLARIYQESPFPPCRLNISGPARGPTKPEPVCNSRKPMYTIRMDSEPADGGNLEWALDGDKAWRHCSEFSRETAWEEKLICAKCEQEVARSRISGYFSHLVRTHCLGGVPANRTYVELPTHHEELNAPDRSWLKSVLTFGAVVVTGVAVAKFCNTPLIENSRAAWWKPWEPKLLTPIQALCR
jgi:hypothetical protein